MRIRVEVFSSYDHFVDHDEPFLVYDMNNADDTQRRRLGESCNDAFKAGQVVLTYPAPRE